MESAAAEPLYVWSRDWAGDDGSSLALAHTGLAVTAEEGQVVVHPMMYLAMSYDHRIVDGREAVTFLVRVKECLEDPTRILLDI